MLFQKITSKPLKRSAQKLAGIVLLSIALSLPAFSASAAERKMVVQTQTGQALAEWTASDWIEVQEETLSFLGADGKTTKETVSVHRLTRGSVLRMTAPNGEPFRISDSIRTVLVPYMNGESGMQPGETQELSPENGRLTLQLGTASQDKENGVYALELELLPYGQKKLHQERFFFRLVGEPAQAGVPAIGRNMTLLVNGKKTTCAAYNIDQNNYFSVRDIAALLSGTEKQFDLAQEGADGTLRLRTGAPYTKRGGEFAPCDGQKQYAAESDRKVYVNDKEEKILSYTIGGNAYFKLRDLGTVIGFSISWDPVAETISIATRNETIPMPTPRLVPKPVSTIQQTGGLLWPCPAYTRISEPYGNRVHPVTRTYKLHKGMDLAGDRGKSIRAVAAGLVIKSYRSDSFGNCVAIQHDNGWATVYAHMDTRFVHEGQSVFTGQAIGTLGATGRSTGSHLHFELHMNGTTADPMKYFAPSEIQKYVTNHKPPQTPAAKKA